MPISSVLFDPTDTTCLPCPDQASCSGGATLVPSQGFWHSAADSASMVQCPNSKACQGNLTNLLNCQTAHYNFLSIQQVNACLSFGLHIVFCSLTAPLSLTSFASPAVSIQCLASKISLGQGTWSCCDHCFCWSYFLCEGARRAKSASSTARLCCAMCKGFVWPCRR